MSDLPYDQSEADVLWRKYHSLMNLHYELASLYRAKSTDRKGVAFLWSRIDQLEWELKSAGVDLG